MRRTFYPPDVVDAWQPRARHFYHTRGWWNAPAFMAWIGRGLAVWCEETGVSREGALRGEGQHAAFTAWLEQHCPKCGEDT